MHPGVTIADGGELATLPHFAIILAPVIALDPTENIRLTYQRNEGTARGCV